MSFREARFEPVDLLAGLPHALCAEAAAAELDVELPLRSLGSTCTWAIDQSSNPGRERGRPRMFGPGTGARLQVIADRDCVDAGAAQLGAIDLRGVERRRFGARERRIGGARDHHERPGAMAAEAVGRVVTTQHTCRGPD